MVAYAQQSSQCRRQPLARALGERLPPDACGGGAMCDVCTGEARGEKVDVTGAAKVRRCVLALAGWHPSVPPIKSNGRHPSINGHPTSCQALVGLVRAACAKKDKGGRITHRALAEAFVKEHKKKQKQGAGGGKKGKGGEEEGDGNGRGGGGVWLQDRETVERLINQLCLDSVLGEDFSASSYTINSYVVVGYQVSGCFAADDEGEGRVGEPPGREEWVLAGT